MFLIQPVLAPHTQFFIWLLLSTSPQLLVMLLLPSRPMSNCSTLCLALYSAQCQWHFSHTSSFPCQSQSLSPYPSFFFLFFFQMDLPHICFLSFYVFVVAIIPWTLQISSVFSVPAFLPGLTVVILPSNFKPLHFIPSSILGCSQPSTV